MSVDTDGRPTTTLRLPHGSVGRFGPGLAMGVVSIPDARHAIVHWTDGRGAVDFPAGAVDHHGDVAVRLDEIHRAVHPPDSYLVVSFTVGGSQ